ncbi:MAG TPA: serine hydrolase domain-containing protein [Blastocatellia bacterium]|nr:serine hydrolase domain-containing protein [Blastocatellia bacterium]
MRHLRRFASAVSASLLILFLCAARPSFAADDPVRPPRRVAEGSLPQPRFADPDRARKLAAAFPEIERLFASWVERTHMPGAVMGIIIDGEMVWVKSAGVRDLTSRDKVTADTVFRIASMTKSFTAMMILKLRDEGKLSLDDPVAKYVSELADLPYPTKDSPVLTIRHLLTHSEGFPEDNPWGDRQLAQSNETMSAWMRDGIPFSNAPGVAYEYSNYGFAILGQVVSRVCGKPYAACIRDQILTPLGMRSTTFEMAEVPRDRIASGHKWEEGAWKNEPALAHGSFGSMGGIWTSARDLARYVAFLMSAFPPRDEAESGPIRRSSAREMQQAWRAQPARAIRPAIDAPLQLNVSSYGYGLGVSQDCRFSYTVGHGGGLPGYGSLMRWLPEHGVGLIAMGNVTYASFGGLFNDALSALHRTGALQPRVVQPSPALLYAQKELAQLILHWDDKLAARIVADNLFLDEPAERRAAYFRTLTARHGSCPSAPAINAENGLRGSWRMVCERGWLEITITLAPTMPPRAQYLNVQSILPPNAEMTKTIDTILRLMTKWDDTMAESILAPGFAVEQMRRQITAAASWGNCKTSEPVGGDGFRDSAVRLSCERGSLLLRVSLDPATQRLASLSLSPTRDQRCAP